MGTSLEWEFLDWRDSRPKLVFRIRKLFLNKFITASSEIFSLIHKSSSTPSRRLSPAKRPLVDTVLGLKEGAQFVLAFLG